MAYSDLLIWQYQDKPKALTTIKLLEETIAQGFIDLYQLRTVYFITCSYDFASFPYYLLT